MPFASYLWLVLLLVSLPLLEGCGVKYVSGVTAPDFQEYPIKKIAVLPFQNQQVLPDVKISNIPPVAEGSDHLLTQIFVERLQATSGYQIIPQEQVEAGFKTAQAGGSGTITTRLTQEVGKALGADAVITGRVQRFTERAGGSLESQHPASVGFDVEMINVGDGKTLWSSQYYETQKTLTEDVNTLPLFWKRGGKWLTARELAEYGIEEMIKTLPKKR
ncbi:MAG TPA: CsgG/HfaB family protein [Nitrospiria bacterium]|nr:CsgG/HfaB family protein [Nitrospiria bacterium]